MKRNVGYALALLAAVIMGYFLGREHVKYELRSAFRAAAQGVQDGFSAFGSSKTTDQNAEDRKQEQQSGAAESEYINKYLELYDVSAKYMNSLLDGRVPGVLFKIRNRGQRTLNEVEVTVYFKDEEGRVIAEENFHPVLVTQFSLDNKPLKPGYIWQMEAGKFYSAKQVPIEWKVGSIDAAITGIEFAE